MRLVILFGGGDGGGMLITGNGVHRIPPFDPPTLKALRSAAAIVHAAATDKSPSIRKKASKLATSLCNLAVEKVEAVVGPLDPELALVFQDPEGGFACGSVGRRPVAIPWAAPAIPSVPEMIAGGATKTDLFQLLRTARLRKIAVTELFEEPDKVADELGVTLSARSAEALRMIAPSRVESIKDGTDRELVKFFHAVVKDGRYLDTWFTHPYEVSQALGDALSNDAIERLLGRGLELANPEPDPGGPISSAGSVIGIVGVAILVGIAVIWGFSREMDETVRDFSGIEKV